MPDNTQTTFSQRFCIENDSIINLNDFFASNPQPSSDWINTTLNETTKSKISPSDFNLGTYIFKNAVQQNNCKTLRIFTLTIHDDCVKYDCLASNNTVKINNVVSPNNDLVNDIFKVDFELNPNNPEPCNIKISLKIFNRWGTLVYENTDYKNTWDGTNTLNSVGTNDYSPKSTYFYVVKLINSNQPPIQGFFLLIHDK